MSDDPSSHPFWKAVSSNAVAEAREHLAQDASLASKDFRSDEAQREDPYDTRFPLIKVSQSGFLEMAELLLQHGVDVDAKTPTEDQRAIGRPILAAVENEHYQVAHLLLNHGASVDAHGYCSASLVEELYEAARKVGAPVDMIRKGFERYLGECKSVALSPDAPEVMRLFDRVLKMGGQPSLSSVVHDRYYELVEELFRTCPEEAGTRHDHPHGTVFVNLCDAGSWGGYPKVFELAMEICPQLHGPAEAKRAIHRALVSHNRDGTVADYEDLIETQLLFLRDRGFLRETIEDGSLLPHYLLAKDYLWPRWCGPEASPSTVESMIALSELFVRYGFTEVNRRDPESGLTAVEQTLERDDQLELHQYAAYLRQRLGT